MDSTAALLGLSPEIDPLYVSISPASAYGEFLNQGNVRCLTTFMGPYERHARRERQNVSFTPLQYTDATRWSAPTGRRTTWSSGRHRWTSAATSTCLSLQAGSRTPSAGIADQASSTQIVVEVNPHMPRVYGLAGFGNNEVSISPT